MFPLLSRKIVGYSFLQPTFYGTKHLGTDYGNYGDKIFAPFDGKILLVTKAQQGGNTIWLKPKNLDVIIRFLHLDKFLCTQGDNVKEGDILGIVGFTGLVNPPGVAGSHVHLDISKHQVNINNTSNFIDPEKFGWKGIMAQISTQSYKGENRIVLKVSTPEQWVDLCKVYGLDPAQIDETVA
jgi:murein DD-endopeptidase MepM/ murein hydrolase activator NlpD